MPDGQRKRQGGITHSYRLCACHVEQPLIRWWHHEAEVKPFTTLPIRFLLTSALCLWQPFSSSGTPSWTISQLTPEIPAKQISIPAFGGTIIAFPSNADLVPGGNADGNFEIFLFDQTANTITQITSALSGTSVRVTISADGTKVAFSSSANLTGGNSDGSREIFLYDALSGLQQVTNSTNPAQISESPSLSADATKLVLTSSDNLDPIGDNAEGNTEVFLYDVIAGGPPQQLTNATSGLFPSTNPKISADGQFVAFTSNFNDFPNPGPPCPALAPNPEHSNEVLVMNLTTMCYELYTQTTICGDSPCDARGVSISADGRYVAYVSNRSLAGPSNPNWRFVVFLWDRVTPLLTQVTDATGLSASQGVDLAAISSDGSRIAFNGNGAWDPSVGNTDGNHEIFLYDTTSASIMQLTNTSGGGTFANYLPSISANGRQIAFSSSRDSNPGDGSRELFLAEQPNEAPELDPVGNRNGTEGALLQFPVSATDPDGDSLTLTARMANGDPLSTIGAAFTDNGDGTGQFSWTPTYDQAGSYLVTLEASDGDLADSETITVTVANTNRPPVLDAIGPQSATEGAALVVNVSANDPDGTVPSLSANLSGLPAGHNGVFTDHSDGTGTFQWTPDFDDATGPYPVTFTASDGALPDGEVVQVSVHEGVRPATLLLDRLTLKAGNDPATDSFKTRGDIQLDPASEGINPPAEGVVVRLNGEEFSTQAGEWKPLTTGGWLFRALKGPCSSGNNDCLSLVKIKPIAPKIYRVLVKARNVDLTGLLTAGLTVDLELGNDGGSQDLSCSLTLKKASCAPAP